MPPQADATSTLKFSADFADSVGHVTQLQTTYLTIRITSGGKTFVYRIDYIEKRRFRIESDWVEQISIADKHAINLSAREPNCDIYIGKTALPTPLVRSAALKVFSNLFEDWFLPSEFINSYILTTSNQELTDCLVYSGPESFSKLFKQELVGHANHLNIISRERKPETPGKVLLFGSSFVWADDFKVTKVQ